MFIISFSQLFLYDYSQGVIVIFLPLLLPRGGDLWGKRRFITIKLLELAGCIIPLGIFS